VISIAGSSTRIFVAMHHAWPFGRYRLPYKISSTLPRHSRAISCQLIKHTWIGHAAVPGHRYLSKHLDQMPFVATLIYLQYSFVYQVALDQVSSHDTVSRIQYLGTCYDSVIHSHACYELQRKCIGCFILLSTVVVDTYEIPVVMIIVKRKPIR
jgi:hypothetical protein